MLTHFIVATYKGIVEIGLWIMLVIGTILGFAIGTKLGSGGVGLLLGFVATFFFLSIFFGAALLLADIHSMLKDRQGQHLTSLTNTRVGDGESKRPTKKLLSELGIVFDGQFYYVREFKFEDVDDAIERAKILAVQNGIG